MTMAGLFMLLLNMSLGCFKANSFKVGILRVCSKLNQ